MNAPAAAADSILVFVPVGKETVARDGPATAARHTGSTSWVIGLLDNHKHNSAQVLDRLQQRLAEKIHDAQFVRMKKPEAGKGAPTPMLDALAARCQAVVTGIVDWGSCTSWSVHDSVELEKRGVATATIVTSGFVTATQTHRRLLKHPELAYSVVPHPIVSMSEDALNACADAIADEIAAAVSRIQPTGTRA